MRLPDSTFQRDLLLAAVLTCFTQVELLLAGDRVEGPVVVQHLAFLAMTGSVALRRTRPVTAAMILGAGMAAQTLAGSAPAVGGFLAMLVVVTSLGYYASLRGGLAGLAAVAFGALLYDVVSDDLVVADLLANAAIVVLAWGAGLLLRRSLDGRIAAEVGHERQVRDAVDAERARIARDLHDSVAHALTLITLQAGGARERSDDPQVVRTLSAIEDGGRDALRDMQRFLRLIGPEPDRRSEAPRLDDLDDMVSRVRAGGLDVRMELEVDPDEVPASVAATAYRVVQEGITNAVKHAGAERVDVLLRRDGTSLLVVVEDDGDGEGHPPAPRAGSGGNGLRGLRERVALFDGRLSAGRHRGRGWRIEASIPLEGQLGG